MLTAIRPVTYDNGKLAYWHGEQDINEYGKFRVGDTVTRGSFCDCNGKFHPPVNGLTVDNITIHSNKHVTYVRIKASGSGYVSIEGNERYFDLAVQS